MSIILDGTTGLQLPVPLTPANGGTGAATQQAAINALAGSVASGQYLRGDGTNVTMSAIQAADVPTLNQNTTGTASNVTGIVAVANGGTGTSTPSLVAGTNVTITGTWPNQTIDASGGGASYDVGEIVVSTDPPTSGTWLETGKYYSKATYPALAATVGDVPDLGPVAAVSQAQLPRPFAPSTTATTYFSTATDGVTTVAVGSSGAIRKTTDGTTWTSVISTTTVDLYSAFYLNNTFLATSDHFVLTSTDGTNWELRTLGITTVSSSIRIASAAYGSGKYVVVGQSGLVAYSSDLVTWNKPSTEATNNFNQVIYANGLFVAVGISGSSCYTSSDGITWTSQSVGGSSFYDVIYANSLFVAVGTSGACYTSADGITWTSRSAGSNQFNQVIYNNSLFVAVGNSGTIYTSSDGITWTARTSNLVANINAITWNGTSFVAVGTNGRWASSTDGITWTANVDASLAFFRSVSVVNGKTIAFGNSASVILAGATRAEVMQGGFWAYDVSAQSAPNPRVIAYNGSNQYVAVGSGGVVMSSSDGQTWTAHNVNVTTNFDKVQYLNGNYIAMGGSGSGANLLTSPDGTTWTAQTAGSAVYNAAAFGASIYVVVGVGGAVFSSPDLVTWTTRSAGSNTFNDVIFANSVFVAVGASGACYSSTDGITWTSRSAGSTQFNRIIYANSLFVAIGNSGVIYTSPDGTTWTVRTSSVSGNLNDVVWNGSIFCAVGASGVITTSPNGSTWTARTPGENNSLLSITWDGTQFMASAAVTPWSSTDGITWKRNGTNNRTNTSIYVTYLGGRFLLAGSNFIQTSVDGFTWSSCDQIPYTVTTVNRLYKFGANYYAATSGVYNSSDGITFTLSSRKLPLNILSIAYSGSVWVCAISGNSGIPTSVYRSTDGTNWTKAVEFGTSPTSGAGTNTVTLGDIVYANGNFIISLNGSTGQGLFAGIYTSSDGITWTPRQGPIRFFVSSILATNGTDVWAGINNIASTNILLKSSDGGVTWSLFSSGQRPIYDGNYLIADTVISEGSGTNTIAPLLTLIYAYGLHVYNNFSIQYTSLSTKQLVNLKTGFITNLPVTTITGYFPTISVPAGGYKPYVLRGTTAMTCGFSASNNFQINPIVEFPLYSYDTATTFWVPPQGVGAGQTAYIYAGA